jgi:hypothetical protein
MIKKQISILKIMRNNSLVSTGKYSTNGFDEGNEKKYEQSRTLLLTRLIIILSAVLLGFQNTAKTQSATDTITKKTPVQRPAARAPVPAILPGKGLMQHDFLYSGEWDTRKDTQTIFRIQNGKVVWTWSIPIKDRNGQLSEFSDIHQLSNGNVLYACKTGAAEVTQNREIVWSYECPEGTECHSAQPVGLDKVFLCQNGTPAKAMLIKKKPAR